LHKTAAHSPAEEYIRSITPEPGKSVVLVIGLGDHETYGPNRNGDGFPSEAVKGKISSDEVLPKHYKSYEKAHVFEHHVNHDPAKAIGVVKKAFWNPHMRRVEVIEDFSHEKAPHLLEKIAAGEYPAKSMGCRIKYDVCTTCGNKARTRAEYCDHLKYAMSQIDPHTGRQNAALNPSPDFFDSSWVIRPADRTGYMLKKVAKDLSFDVRLGGYELSDLVTDVSNKAAALRKAADIEKVLQGDTVATVSSLKPEDVKLIKKYDETQRQNPKDNSKVVQIMITYKPSAAVGSADSAELPLGLKDLMQYFLGRMSPDMLDAADDCACKAASDHTGLILETFSKYPRFFEETLKLAQLDACEANPQLVEKLADSDFSTLTSRPFRQYLTGYRPSTMVEDYDYRRETPMALRHWDERPLTDVVHYTEPTTGQQYTTNYGAVQRAHDRLIGRGKIKNWLLAAPMLGGSALLGAAALGRKFQNKPAGMLGLGALGLGALGAYTGMRDPEIAGPRIRTDEGETISGWTEMVPKYASDTAPELAYISKRASDSRPEVLPAHAISAYWQAIKEAEVHDELDNFVGCTLDFDKVAQALGMSILRLTA
jgi:hypothetical protein